MHRVLLRSAGASLAVLMPLLLALGIHALAHPEAASQAQVVVLPVVVVSAPPAAADS